MALRPASAWVPIAIIGGLVVLLGIAFVTIRPALVLLPEDQRFTGLSPEALQAMNPRLFTWIGLVFRSWGAFAIGLGVLILSIAATGFRSGDRSAWWALAVSGSSTLAIFLAVNIALHSDFLVFIAIVAFVYAFALWRGARSE